MGISILNDVLGPIMRGPSSSHTAGAYHIGSMVRDLLGEQPVKAVFTFDPEGSYSQTYNKQNADKGFISGLLGRSLLDENFDLILKEAVQIGIEIEFKIDPLPEADHPNFVKIELTDNRGEIYTAMAKSTGGGSIILSHWNGWPVKLDGSDYGGLVFLKRYNSLRDIENFLEKMFKNVQILRGDNEILLVVRSSNPVNLTQLKGLEDFAEKIELIAWKALHHVKKGNYIFKTLEDLETYAKQKELSLGQVALEYEADLLGLSQEQSKQEMLKRLKVMQDSVQTGLNDSSSKMQLLNPTASKIYKAINEKKVSLGGPHALAGVRAMAVMHACNSGAIICAAPTGGSAGVIPGVIVTLIKDLDLDESSAIRALFAAGAIGWAVASQATFAAETAGCQVEIGAAGAMAAAAVVEVVGGSVRHALDAAAIAFQNTMGLICDLVQGTCEIPCHTRNAAAASNAFLCADLILGGYENPIPLDETIDAVYDVGKMLPSALLCTSKGGLAITPSALNIKNKTLRRKESQSFTGDTNK